VLEISFNGKAELVDGKSACKNTRIGLKVQEIEPISFSN
jgi:hypothetical protein